MVFVSFQLEILRNCTITKQNGEESDLFHTELRCFFCVLYLDRSFCLLFMKFVYVCYITNFIKNLFLHCIKTSKRMFSLRRMITVSSSYSYIIPRYGDTTN